MTVAGHLRSAPPALPAGRDGLALQTGAVEARRSLLLLGPRETGVNNLAEFLFLMHVGSLQWREIARSVGKRLRDLRSEDGRPVYASFFYIWERFPVTRSMASHRIDDELTILSGIRPIGGVALDGWHAVFPEELEPIEASPPAPEEWSYRGPGWVRMSNVFVQMRGGPEDLEVTMPRDLQASAGGGDHGCVETYRLAKEVRRRGRFAPPVTRALQPLHPPRRTCRVRINPDRDINGVGLVYFANYVTYLDLAERSLLQRIVPPGAHHAIDRRSLVEREIAYYGNAAAGDRLLVDVTAHRLAPAPADPHDVALLWFDYSIRRESDRRLICLSRAVKSMPRGAV